MLFEFAQHGAGWHAWRHQGIGASDIHTLLSKRAVKGRRALLAAKRRPFAESYAAESTGPVGPERFPMLYGKAIERAMVTAFVGLRGGSYRPCCAEYDPYPRLRASLDGYDRETDTLLELKCLGADGYAEAREARLIPPRYYAQVQCAMLVTGAELAYYLVYPQFPRLPFVWSKDLQDVSIVGACDPARLVVFEVTPDRPFQGEILRAARAAWSEVEAQEGAA